MDLISSSTNAFIQPATPGKNISSLDNIKSGYDIKKQAPVLNVVSWPHGFLGQVQNITNIGPDKLFIEAFLYGYFVILLHVQDNAEIKGRMLHAKQLMSHTMLYGWESARNFHYAVLREIEIGNFGWSDQSAMQLLALSAPGMSVVKSSTGSASGYRREERASSYDSTESRSTNREHTTLTNRDTN